jgi:hypothetical protein
MNASKLSLVPLQQASLCLDCDMITAAHTHCFVCGSIALLNLARTLNGGESPTSMPGTFAAVANVSAGRPFEAESMSGRRSWRSLRFAGECVPFPHSSAKPGSATSGTEPPDGRGRYSMREIAAVVHRTMTSAIVGILVFVAATQAHGQSFEGHANASNNRHTYTRWDALGSPLRSHAICR